MEHGSHKMNLYLKEHGFSSVKGYNGWKTNITWSSNKTGVTERHLFDAVTKTPQELFNYVFVRYTCMANVKHIDQCGQHLGF